MLSLGLSADDQAAFIRGLLGTHTLRVRVQILDTTHRLQGDVSTMLLDGAVTVDALADVTRSASLSLYDPDHQLQLDSNAPVDGALYYDRMISLAYQVTSYEYVNPDNGEPITVTVPVFTGPISSMDRDSDVVSLEAMGKEVFSQPPSYAWRTRNYGIGTLRTSIVRELLENTGETRFNIEPWSLRTANVFGVTAETNVWSLAKKMAGDRMLYYDGAGTLVMRQPLTRTVFTFTDGDGGSVLTKPKFSYRTDDLRNIVRVKGGIPKGWKTQVVRTAYAPASHPLSAQSLGRNGHARHLVEIIEDQDLVTPEACQERADKALALALKTEVAAAFDGIPVPMMEWGDMIAVRAGGVSVSSRLDQFTLPLKAGESMAYGFNDRRSTVAKAAIRRRR